MNNVLSTVIRYSVFIPFQFDSVGGSLGNSKYWPKSGPRFPSGISGVFDSDSNCLFE